MLEKQRGLKVQARYDDPVIGRFLSNDPVGFAPDRPDMFNRYAYAANDPVNMIDPDGEFAFLAAPALPYIVAAIGAAATCVATNCVGKAAEAVGDLISESRSTRPLGELETIDGPGHNAPRPELAGADGR